MAQYAGSGGGGGGAYSSGGSVYSSQVPHAYKAPAKKKKSSGAGSAYKKGGSVYNSQVPRYHSSPKPRTPTYRPSNGGGGGGGNNGQRSSGGGGGYGSSNSGVGSSSKGAVVPKVKPPPSMKDYLKTDSTYQGQQAALQKALADYTAQKNLNSSNYMTNYASDKNAWETNRKSSMADLENDYASRGLLQSGLYADALATGENDWNSKLGQLDNAKMQYLQGLDSGLSNFTAQQGITNTQAQQEAAARRAAKYGIA